MRAAYDGPGYEPQAYPGHLREILGTEFSERFADLMRNRMIISHEKYGALADAYPKKIDAIKSLHQRLQKYEETGNAEWPVDAANFAMIEFMHPRHPEAHFRGTDSNESPGRTDALGHATFLDNTDPTTRRLAARYAARSGD